MSILADALQPSTVSGLTRVAGYAGRISMPDFILGGPKVGFDLNFDHATKTISLGYREPALLAPLASDCCRTSSACFQTAISIRTQNLDKLGIPWFIVKMYYASFYAAHALLRIFGDSCSFFHHIHINRIVKLYEISGRAVPFTLERGLYMCSLDASASSMSCQKIVGGNGGSHEAFWDVFGAMVGRLAEAALTAPLSAVEAQDIFNKLECLQNIMKQRGPQSFSWLSYIRNEIQYRHQFETWMPSSIKQNECNALRRLAAMWTGDPLSIELDIHDKVLRKFISVCAFIIAAGRVMLFRIAERSADGPRSFLNVGPLSILKREGVVH